MTAKFRTHGLDIVPLERLPGSLYAFDGTILRGTAFPAVIAEPDGVWYGRRTGKAAVRFDGRHQALAHIAGGCPDCSCEPDRCVPGEVSDTCLDCTYCLKGCTDGICPGGSRG